MEGNTLIAKLLEYLEVELDDLEEVDTEYEEGLHDAYLEIYNLINKEGD